MGLSVRLKEDSGEYEKDSKGDWSDLPSVADAPFSEVRHPFIR